MGHCLLGLPQVSLKVTLEVVQNLDEIQVEFRFAHLEPFQFLSNLHLLDTVYDIEYRKTSIRLLLQEPIL